MKQPVLFVAAAGALLMAACKKTSPLQNSALVGKWAVVNDTTFLGGTPIFSGGSQNYLGAAGDYFDFTASGNLYVKEGANTDTATWSIAGSTLKITYYYANGTGFPNGASKGAFTVTNLTANTVTLTLPEIITPDGAEYEQINLKR